MAATLSSPLCASAAEIDYAPGQGADVVKNVGGLAYVGLLAFWLFKVVGRRIKKSTTEAGLMLHIYLYKALGFVRYQLQNESQMTWNSHRRGWPVSRRKRLRRLM